MRRGMNSIDMQKKNRVLVFRTLLDNRGMTRTKVAEQIGLQKATITNIINEFYDIGIVKVEGDTASGRRAEKVCLKLEDIYLMSMGITRKDYQVAVYSLDGVQLESRKYSFRNNEDLQKIVDRMKRDAVDMQQRYGKERIMGVLLAVPGPFMSTKADGKETFAVSEFPRFNDIEIRKQMEAALGASISMVHDAKLSAYAEWKHAHEAKADHDASLVVIRSRGYGIGAGIVIGGRIVEGQLGIAGEIGYMGINYNGRRNVNDSFEACAGTESAVRYMLERLHEFPDTELCEDSSYADVVHAYRSGDPLAVWAVEKMCWMLGYGISNMMYLFNPDCIILGQDYPDDEAFIQKLRQILSERVHPLMVQNASIRYSKLSQDSFIRGGYYYMIEKLTEESDFFERIRAIRQL